MDYTTEQAFEMAMAKKELSRTGHPSAVSRITVWMEDGRPFKEIQKIYQPVKVKPEIVIPLDDIPTQPPTHGKGSGNKPWRAFAKAVSDMDHEIIDSMSAPDLVTVLKDKGVIE